LVSAAFEALAEPVEEIANSPERLA
jgi:hypothetical protein